MLLKILGSFLVIAASSFLGYVLSADCSKRPQELRAMQAMLHMLENEIAYLSSILSEAFEKLCKSNPGRVSVFFEATACNLKDGTMSGAEAWSAAVKDNLRKTSLNSEDAQILLSFGNMLGSSDLEGQIKNIRLTLEQLKLQEQKAEDNKKRYETMYRTLGIMGGIMLVIIFI